MSRKGEKKMDTVVHSGKMFMKAMEKVLGRKGKMKVYNNNGIH